GRGVFGGPANCRRPLRVLRALLPGVRMLPPRVCQFSAALLFVASAASAEELAAKNAALENWGQWRGPLATGEAPKGSPPLTWDEPDGTNIRWKTEIPGRGHSTPVVWG